MKKKAVYTTYDIENRLFVAHSTVAYWCQTGKIQAEPLRCKKDGYEITKKALDEFLNKHQKYKKIWELSGS